MIEGILAKSPKRFDKWNDLSDELREFVTPHVEKKIAEIVKEYKPPQEFNKVVVLVIAGVGMEQEYADLVPPSLCAMLADWYIKGRFPCGWKGEYPKGKLIVY
jgi:hypothetical protein